MMKYIKHRANDLATVSYALKQDKFAGVELDVQFNKDGYPVICHDVDKANQKGNTHLYFLKHHIASYPFKLFLIEIKPCLWKDEYAPTVIALLQSFKNFNVRIISFSDDILFHFAVAGFRTALIGSLGGGRYDYYIPEGLVSTHEEARPEYLLR